MRSVRTLFEDALPHAARSSEHTAAGVDPRAYARLRSSPRARSRRAARSGRAPTCICLAAPASAWPILYFRHHPFVRYCHHRRPARRQDPASASRRRAPPGECVVPGIRFIKRSPHALWPQMAGLPPPAAQNPGGTVVVPRQGPRSSNVASQTVAHAFDSTRNRPVRAWTEPCARPARSAANRAPRRRTLRTGRASHVAACVRGSADPGGRRARARGRGARAGTGGGAAWSPHGCRMAARCDLVRRLLGSRAAAPRNPVHHPITRTPRPPVQPLRPASQRLDRAQAAGIR